MILMSTNDVLVELIDIVGRWIIYTTAPRNNLLWEGIIREWVHEIPVGSWGIAPLNLIWIKNRPKISPSTSIFVIFLIR